MRQGGRERAHHMRLLADESERLFRHLALAPVGEQPRRLLERQPARLRDLDSAAPAAMSPSRPPRVAEEVEAHDLEDPLAGPRVDVADVAELRHEPRLDARLLGDLAQGRLLRPLARVDEALRQRPDAAVCVPPAGSPPAPSARAAAARARLRPRTPVAPAHANTANLSQTGRYPAASTVAATFSSPLAQPTSDPLECPGTQRR